MMITTTECKDTIHQLGLANSRVNKGVKAPMEPTNQKHPKLKYPGLFTPQMVAKV